MNKVKFLTFLVAALVIINVVLLVFMATRPGGGPGPGKGGPDRIIIDKLELTETQVREFEMLKKAHRETVRAYQDSIRLMKKSFIDALRTDQPDQVKAAAIAAEIAALQEKIEMTTFLHFKSLRELCDDRQKALFDEFIQEIARMIGRPPGPPEKK